MTVKQARVATIERNTKETQIKLELNLDDASQNKDGSISTGLPFFDHMLTALATHGQFGLTIQAKGDLEVDPHHLMEDVGIVLGEAFRQALPQYKGIWRAGCFRFPMDGTLADVAVDLCGRPNLVWGVSFGPFLVGELDPNLFHEFYKGWADGARATLHIQVPIQDNDHHVVEATFKAFTRALRQAVTPLSQDISLSTKGMLDA
jgi:imidazoleglycerol-phosphate dehydratase